MNRFELRRHQALVVLGVVVLCVTHSRAKAQWEELLQPVPESANAIVLVDVEALRSSPIGVLKIARQKSVIPPEFSKFVLGSSVGIHGLDPEWQAMVAELLVEADPSRFGKRVGSEVDELAGFPAIPTPAGAYLAKISSHVVAGLSPASRRRAAGWLGRIKTASSLDPYLIKAAKLVGQESQVVAALSLKDYRSAKQVEQMLYGEYQFALNKIDTAIISVVEVARFLATVEGLTFTMKVTTGVSGTLRIDFGQPAEILLVSGASKKLVYEFLKDMDAWLEDFEQWDERAEGNTYIMEGRLKITTAEDIFSSMDHGYDATFIASPQSSNEDVVNSTKSETELQLEATLNYFTKLTRILEKLKRYHGGNAGQYAKKWRRAADHIDRLSILHVDPDMLDFGAQTSAAVRQMRRMVKGASARGYIQSVSVGLRYRYGDYTRHGTTRRRAIAAELVPLMEVLDTVDEGISQMRRAMTERYQVEF